MQKRNYGLDLLRIVLMIMIVFMHSQSKTNLIELWSVEPSVRGIMFFMVCMSVCAVNVFVLISGYFMCESNLKISRVIRVCMQVLFYSWIIAAIMLSCNKMQWLSEEMIKSFFPFSYGKMWFAGAYIGICLLSPLLNAAIDSMPQRQHRNCLLILFFMSVLWSDVIPGAHPFGFDSGYSVMWFICLYVLAAYLKKYNIAKKFNSKKTLAIYFISTAIMWLSIFVMSYLLSKVPIVGNYISNTYYCRYNSLLVVIQSCALFLTFVNIDIKNNFVKTCIGVIAPLTFGVYLIHDGSIRFLMWDYVQKLVGNVRVNMMLPVKSLQMVMVVFVGCLIIDYIRSLIFRFIENRKCVKKFYKKIDSLQI